MSRQIYTNQNDFPSGKSTLAIQITSRIFIVKANINQPERYNPCSANLSDLLPATEEEITKILRSSQPKTCDLDPAPAQLLKQCETAIIPVLTVVVKNLSEAACH